GEKLDKLASSLMAHAATPRSDPARLTVQSDPAGASVTVDGRAAGETPLSLDLSPGAHEVAFVASGHAATHKKVVLEPGIRGLLVGGGGALMLTSGLMLFVDWAPSPGAASEAAQARHWMVSAHGTF